MHQKVFFKPSRSVTKHAIAYVFLRDNGNASAAQREHIFFLVISLSEGVTHSSTANLAKKKKGSANRAFPNKNIFVVRLETRTKTATARTAEVTSSETATLTTLAVH